MSGGNGTARETDSNFYEIINGNIYNRELLKKAEEISMNRPIGLDEAKELWLKFIGETLDVAADAQEVDLETFRLILRHGANATPQADGYKLSVDTSGTFFLQTALQEHAKLLKEQQKTVALAEGTPTKRQSRGSPKRSPRNVDPYQEIEELQEKIAGAKNLNEMKRLERKLECLQEKLTPKKMDETPEPKAATPSPGARGRGRGRAKVVTEDVSGPSSPGARSRGSGRAKVVTEDVSGNSSPGARGRGRGRAKVVAEEPAIERETLLPLKRPAAAEATPIRKRRLSTKTDFSSPACQAFEADEDVD